jgi:hypothetical protein
MTNSTLTLYHGSKSGITGTIRPSSREQCDFGRGFYMGTEKRQSLTLIYNRENARLYTLDFDLTGLRVLEFGTELDWALTIAYCRKAMEDMSGSEIYAKYETLATADYDVVVGKIANDRIFYSLDQFFGDFITDFVLTKCLSALELGTQYVAKTAKACSRIIIVAEEPLIEEKRGRLQCQSEQMRIEGVRVVDELRRRYFREGRLFSEIIGRQI